MFKDILGKNKIKKLLINLYQKLKSRAKLYLVFLS